jgi:hypothetical protein
MPRPQLLGSSTPQSIQQRQFKTRTGQAIAQLHARRSQEIPLYGNQHLRCICSLQHWHWSFCWCDRGQRDRDNTRVAVETQYLTIVSMAMHGYITQPPKLSRNNPQEACLACSCHGAFLPATNKYIALQVQKLYMLWRRAHQPRRRHHCTMLACLSSEHERLCMARLLDSVDLKDSVNSAFLSPRSVPFYIFVSFQAISQKSWA